MLKILPLLVCSWMKSRQHLHFLQGEKGKAMWNWLTAWKQIWGCSFNRCTTHLSMIIVNSAYFNCHCHTNCELRGKLNQLATYRHSGHVLVLVSHGMMQVLWNLWEHGSCWGESFNVYSARQMAHMKCSQMSSGETWYQKRILLEELKKNKN